MSVFVLIFAMALWGFVHSLLASHFAKNQAGFPRWYRLAYNIFALASFAPIPYLMTKLPNKVIYEVPAPENILMFGGQLLAVLLIFITILQTDVLSFLGFRELFDGERPGHLITRGLYRLVRHPLYTCILLFIWLTPTMTQNSVAVYVAATIYILAGIHYEEQKLLREFGEDYAEYKRKTPMLIPGSVFAGK